MYSFSCSFFNVQKKTENFEEDMDGKALKHKRVRALVLYYFYERKAQKKWRKYAAVKAFNSVEWEKNFFAYHS